MPDPLLFVLGFLVTVLVGLAVWSVGLLDGDEVAERAAAEARGPREYDRS